MAEAQDMWRCQMVNCGYVYDPDRGDRRHKIPAGTKFEDLPDDWRCPVCGAAKKSSVASRKKISIQARTPFGASFL